MHSMTMFENVALEGLRLLSKREWRDSFHMYTDKDRAICVMQWLFLKQQTLSLMYFKIHFVFLMHQCLNLN